MSQDIKKKKKIQRRKYNTQTYFLERSEIDNNFPFSINADLPRFQFHTAFNIP